MFRINHVDSQHQAGMPFVSSLTSIVVGEQKVSAFDARTFCEGGAACRLALEVGGADRDRTGDPLLAKQVLSQLSYSPLMVGLDRLELSTSPLSGVRSSHLSYRPASTCADLDPTLLRRSFRG